MVTAKEYADKFQDKPDQKTSLGIIATTAQAGHDWAEQSAKLRSEGKTTSELAAAAEALALKSVADEKVFLDKAGTKPIVEAYVKDLVERSKAKDKEQGKPEGTNLVEYMDKTAAAVNKEYPGKKFDEVKEKVKKAFESGEPSLLEQIQLSSDINKFKNISRDVSSALASHIGTGGRPMEDDFLHTIKENTKAQAQVDANSKKKNNFDVALTTEKLPEKGMGNDNFMKVVAKILEMILGFDIVGLFTGKGKEEDKQVAAKAPESKGDKKEEVQTAAGKAEIAGEVKTINEKNVADFLKKNGSKGEPGTKPQTDTGFKPTNISVAMPKPEIGASRI